MLASRFRAWTDRPIVNMTGLMILYEFKLHFADPIQGTRPEPLTSPGAADPSGPSVFTAIQELGLKLQSIKAPLETLLIDSVQRPSENCIE